MRQAGFFDVDERLQRLSDLGDQLEAYGATVDFEMFRAELEAALAYSDGAKGGRPPYDPVMMFKILVIQAQNNLSDDRAEFLINDRLSFMRFLGLSLGDRVPDAKTIWLFRERLTEAGAVQRLFDRFDAAVRAAGYIPMSGQIVDASLVAAPKQRNSDDEKADIKAGRIPPAWRDKPWPLQNRGRPSARTVALLRGGRVRHTGMGRLVQQSPAAGAYRQHPAGRSRGTLLRHAGRASHGSMTQTKQPPPNPARFNHSAELERHQHDLRLD